MVSICYFHFAQSIDSISRGFLILMPEVATKPLISHLLPQPHVYKSTQQLQQINIAPNVLEKCQEARLIDGQYDMRETIIVNDKVILTYKNIVSVIIINNNLSFSTRT